MYIFIYIGKQSYIVLTSNLFNFKKNDETKEIKLFNLFLGFSVQ